jgi:hypothetical protein
MRLNPTAATLLEKENEGLELCSLMPTQFAYF